MLPQPAKASRVMDDSSYNSSSTEAGVPIAITGHGPTPPLGGTDTKKYPSSGMEVSEDFNEKTKNWCSKCRLTKGSILVPPSVIILKYLHMTSFGHSEEANGALLNLIYSHFVLCLSLH
ncbi:hypothetical protein AVEN_253497-1 [Araneus ventricosus]|uniref:Uncharacterized protein n=1 Tax=Araneus ventricosus TaxID=182803 RepID=A0A4Y2BVK4_ARAVE|nr:hypothetical protein AVEN_253497-1 [Araneus ventricosus]